MGTSSFYLDVATSNKVTVKASKKGGTKIASLLLVNQALATLAFFGVGVNLVLFLTRVLGQSNAHAANNVSKWTGTVYMFSLVAAFLSDSYWGRYLTCTIFQIIFVLGLALSSLSSWLFLIKPDGCGDGNSACLPTSSIGISIFYFSIYLVAFGYGGHQPTLATFGADQYDEKDPKEKTSLVAFFCYFYFALNVGSLFSNTVLVYYEDSGKWTMGFLVSLAAAVLALTSFLSGTTRYRYVKPCGNPAMRVAQVFVAFARKRSVFSAKADQLFEVEGPQSAIKGSRKILHSDDFIFMDKAATVIDSDEVSPMKPWRLCTVTQVEEAKCVLRMLPVWLCTIIYSVVFTQMASLFVEQGDVMNSNIGKFHLPAASMSAFDICSVLVCTCIYQQILVPIVRLRHIIHGQKTSSLSIFWQIPQYVLVGASEVFMYVGQLEFFNGQAPDGIKSFGSSLCMASISLGNYVSSMLVNMVMGITGKGPNGGWITENLNTGHMDRFFFLLAALAAFDFVLYLFCAKWYKSINLQDSDDVLSPHQNQDQDVISRV
ncbi:hypothetical protein PIB30_055106 [Stylosanthes scabra]|uniref:Uncharacterized protein n=1 Tax=Stylosanthes scabra TaxID=79078 RepID=A0ABU6TLD5_9FABA|nr:hypothetical protein [Stylosanthes scabra]